MIRIDGKIQKCHRCGSNNLSVINVTDGELDVWCNECEESTLEGYLPLDKIKEFDIHKESPPSN